MVPPDVNVPVLVFIALQKKGVQTPSVPIFINPRLSRELLKTLSMVGFFVDAGNRCAGQPVMVQAVPGAPALLVAVRVADVVMLTCFPFLT